MIADKEYVENLKKDNEHLKYRLKTLENIVATSKSDDDDPAVKRLLTREYFDLVSRDHMYRLLIENMSEGAVVVNSKLTIVYSNKLFAEFTGYPLQKVIGADFCKLLKEEDVQKFIICMTESKTEKSYCEVALKKMDSETSAFLLSVTSFLMESEYYHIIIPTDINFHKKIKEGLEIKLEEFTAKLANVNKRLNEKNRKLKEVNKYLDNFVHSIAHDLRAPVSNIKMIEELFNLAPEKDKSLLLLSLFGNIKKLDNTLYGLVEIIEARGMLDKKAENINVLEVIEEILEEKEDIIKALNANIVINKKTNRNIFYVKEFIYSIIRNIISNALKFSDTERPLELTIILKKSKKYYSLNFKDNGIGIDLNKYGKYLFTPFSRFSSQTEGLGIGLHIINTMVERNGGYIEVNSLPGEGTIFSVYLREYLIQNDI